MPLDLGDRRGKRIAVADANIAQGQLVAENVQRETVFSAVVAYYEVLHARRRVELGQERIRLAEAAEETARQRNKAGDAPEFEVNLARGEVARAQGVVAGANSELMRARGRLAATLGLPITSIAVTGDLADRTMFERASTDTVDRADLRGLAQEAKLASAEAQLARAERWPSLDFRLNYQHEIDADILFGGIELTLPVFERGQGEEARARARAKRAETELRARSTVVSTEVESARLAYQAALDSVRVFEDQAVPRSIENENAAAASYRAGKIDFGALLLIRREALDTRREHLDQLLEAALASVDLWIARGAKP